MTDSRQRILAALRQGLADAPVVPGPRAPEVPAPAALPDGPEAWEEFRAALALVRVDLMVAADMDQAHQALLDVVREFSVKKAALWQQGLPLDAASVLRQAGVETVFGLGGACHDFADADLGITGARAALVRPGVIVVRAGQGMPRGASLLPPVHLALVPRSALLPSSLVLPEFLRREARDAGMPSAFHLITGPSSTSDIELTPVFGVHGPTTVRVIGLDF